MYFHQSDNIRYLTFESLNTVPHAVVTRHGGVSSSPWASLNLGGTVGDKPDRVSENRQRAFHSLGFDISSAYDVWQVHGNTVVSTDLPRRENEPHLKADAILTNHPDVTLFMRFADCVPILLWDPIQKVVGLVHAGWQGTVNQTVVSSIQSMQSRYQSKPINIIAAIGPSIGSHHYRVGEEVIKQVEAVFGYESNKLLSNYKMDPARSAELDLWKANSLLLENQGIKNIEIAGICTACNLEDWYSHRGESGKTGRFGVLIKLPTNKSF